MVRDTFRKWRASYLDFLEVAEQCAIRVSPNYKLAWQKVFMLQRLLHERQIMRFAHLLQTADLDCSSFITLDALATRLEADWREGEEKTMREGSAHYRDLSLKIEELRSNHDPHALDESARLLAKDPGYSTALLAMANRTKKFTERVKS